MAAEDGWRHSAPTSSTRKGTLLAVDLDVVERGTAEAATYRSCFSKREGHLGDVATARSDRVGECTSSSIRTGPGWTNQGLEAVPKVRVVTTSATASTEPAARSVPEPCCVPRLARGPCALRRRGGREAPPARHRPHHPRSGGRTHAGPECGAVRCGAVAYASSATMVLSSTTRATAPKPRTVQSKETPSGRVHGAHGTSGASGDSERRPLRPAPIR